jgi:tetratricopeptide (TPR) repeat protein
MWLISLILIFSIVGGIIVALKRNNSNDTHNTICKETATKNYRAFYNNPIIIEHFKNIEDIEKKYSVLYNLKDFHGQRMDNLISQCIRDITISEEYVAIHKKYGEEIPPSYVSFKRLAIIYEKRQEYDNAIQVCIKAIELGFTDNNEMYGRIARLLRKSGRMEEAQNYLQIGKKTQQ